MKIIKFMLICSVLINYSTAHAMDLIPLTSAHNHNHFQINTIQDIPKLSLAHIRPCLNALPDAKRDTLLTTKNKNGVPLSQSLTFNIALLPQELTYKIITYMLDNDEKSATIIFNTQLWYAYKVYDEKRAMIQKSSLKTKPPIGLLLRLPVEQQKEIMGLVTQSSLSNILYSKIVINECDQQKIQLYTDEIQENFFHQDDIAVITEDTKEECTTNFYGLIAVGAITGFVGAGIVLGVMSFSDVYMSGGLILGCLLGMPSLGGATGLIGGGIYEAQTVKQQAQKIKLSE